MKSLEYVIAETAVKYREAVISNTDDKLRLQLDLFNLATQWDEYPEDRSDK